MIMVKAGAPTDAVIEEFAPLLEPGDMIIDGGNAHFLDTRRREAALRERGIHFVGSGVSGGEEGALNGPSIMPGGSKESYAVPRADAGGHQRQGGRQPVLHAHRQRRRRPLRQDGAQRHRVRRHAAHRRGLRPAPARRRVRARKVAEIFRTWNKGRLNSYLIEITAEILAHATPATGKPFVDIVRDEAEQKGTGRWTVQDALDLGFPVTGIAEATFARVAVRPRRPARGRPGLPGPKHPPPRQDAEFADQVEQALYASKLVAYAQGWNMMDVGSREYDWGIDLGQIAVIWRGGCIIRAAFLDRIRAAYADNPHLPTLLADEEFGKDLATAQDSWRNVVATAARLGIPVPGFSAALAYYDALRADRLPAALIQGLRDFFGAHTYRRTDRDGTFHTLWAEGRSEEAR